MDLAKIKDMKEGEVYLHHMKEGETPRFYGPIPDGSNYLALYAASRPCNEDALPLEGWSACLVKLVSSPLQREDGHWTAEFIMADIPGMVEKDA